MIREVTKRIGRTWTCTLEVYGPGVHLATTEAGVDLAEARTAALEALVRSLTTALAEVKQEGGR